MLLFVIELLIFILTFILIHIIYNKNYSQKKGIDNYFNCQALHMDHTLNRILPSDEGFWSLKFSVLRHFVVTLISSIFMLYFNDPLLRVVILWVNIIYLTPKFFVQSKRKRHVNNSPETKRFLKPALSACTIMTVYCFIAFLLFYVAYSIL